MAFTRGILLLGIAVVSQALGFSAIQRSTTDLWDISSGATVLSTSGLRSGFHANAMFGANTSVEPGSAVFSDSRPAGFVHSVDWQTPNLVRLTRVHLFAIGDGPIYQNEREFGQFILKAKKSASDPYMTVHTFIPTHPYTFVDAESRAVLAVDLPPIDAQFFRAEFVQWNAGRGFDGPRIVEIDGFGSVPEPTIPQSRNDLWDVSNGATITGSSGFRGGFNGMDMFGTTTSAEPGSAIFSDGFPSGFTHYLEWKTPTPVRLDSFNVFAVGDGAIYRNEREFGQFTLKAKLRNTDAFTTVYTFIPVHPYEFVDPISKAIISANVPEVDAQFFRAEFVQWNAGRGFDGPRVVELDGFGTQLPSETPTLQIIEQPASQTVTTNSTATFVVTVSSDAMLSYQWFFNGTPIAPGTNRVLSLSNVTTANAGTYFVRITSSGQSITSNPAELTVTSPPGSGPSTDDLFDVSEGNRVVSHSGVFFSSKIEAMFGDESASIERGSTILADGHPAGFTHTVDWRTPSPVMLRRIKLFAVGDGAVYNHEREFRTFTLKTKSSPSSSTYDRTLYTYEATHPYAFINPADVILIDAEIGGALGQDFRAEFVQWNAGRGYDGPRIIELDGFGERLAPLTIVQPLQDLTVSQGASASFHVVAGGAGPFTYRWAFNGQTLPNQVADTLLLSDVQPANAGTYTVTVTSGPSEVSSSATLNVTTAPANPPDILAHPESRIAGFGASAQFSVSATGSSPLTYQWYFNGAAITGATKATLSLHGLTASDAGTYHVVVSNSSGSATSRAAVLNLFSSTVTEGEIYLDNQTPEIDAPVTDDRGLRLTGPDFLVQLWGAPNGQPLAPVGAAIPFGTAESAGYFSDIVARVIPGTASGESVPVEIRVWDARAGSTYDQAAENGGLHAAQRLALTLGGGNLPPASLVGLQPFSLAAKPRITQQPSDVSVSEGRVATFQVTAAGTPPFSYQWKFNNVALAEENRANLILSNVTAQNAGNYSVDVGNRVGSVSSAQAALTVIPRDSVPPVLTITSPADGSTKSSRVTLGGTVTDNVGVVRIELSRNGQLVGPVAFNNGIFSISDVHLTAGVNTLTVAAYDEEGNVGTGAVRITLETSRSLWVAPAAPDPIYEGARLSIPIMVSSDGDIGAISFAVSFDTNYFAEATFDWTQLQSSAFHQVNTNLPGIVRATYVLPGQAIRAGTNRLAVLNLRARSIPETLTSSIGLEVQGIFSITGDSIAAGTMVNPGEVRVVQRRVLGDNNANHRLDIGDATAIIRLVALLEPARAWDITANDLNRNNSLDGGDIVRVLRAVVGLDAQPGPLQQQSLRATAAGAKSILASDKTLLVPGEQVRVRVLLDHVETSISGASFQVDYPTNALLLENASAHVIGPVVPEGALAMWNLLPGQDYATQTGQLRFAASSAAAWSTNNGSIAELTFTVQPAASAERNWSVRVSNVEVASGTDVAAVTSSELILTGRELAPARLATGAYNSTNGQFELKLTGEPGASYKVEFSEDLRTWTQISMVSDSAGTIILTDTSAAGSRRFYRAQLVE